MSYSPVGELPSVTPASLWARLWHPFWARPFAVVLAAGVAALLLPLIDEAYPTGVPYVFEGGPDGARSLLSTIASAMISVTGLVFSITLVVLQLASSQFTPRILGGFLQSRVTQYTLGVFTASFVYALTVLRSVRGGFDGATPFVPQVSVSVAFLLVLASVALFIAFIHHITTSIQVAHVVANIGTDTRQLVRDTYPGDSGQLDTDKQESPRHGIVGPPRSDIMTGQTAGHVTAIDYRRLADVAEEHNGVLELRVAVGEFVVERQLLAVLRAAPGGTSDASDDDIGPSVRSAVQVGRSRTMEQDVAFGLRQLVDVAERALSPGINDPTTAVESIDQIHRILREAVLRHDLPVVVGDDGPRLIHCPQQIGDLVALPVRELAHYGSESIQVPRRLDTMLESLSAVCLPQHRPAVAQARRLMSMEMS